MKKRKKIMYLSSLIIALMFTVDFIIIMIKYVNNVFDILMLIGFSLFIFIFSFLGFGCIIKIILKC